MIVKVTSPSFSRHPDLARELRALFPEAVLNTEGQRFDKAALIDYIRDADALVVGLETIDDDVLAACADLKIIAKYGVGLDGIDLESCKRRNVAIGWTGGVNKRSVAEMALGFMLSLSRNLYSTSIQLKAGDWNKAGGFQLTGKTVGVIGLGHAGTDVIRLLKPFGCTILGNDIEDRSELCAEHGIQSASKDEIFETADLVTLHTPLTDLTDGLIDAAVLERMKPTAYLINTARGPIVRNADLKAALIQGEIAGAALDVYEDEPPTDLEFLALPNLFCTPHIGGNADEAVLAMGRSAIGHLQNYFNQ